MAFHIDEPSMNDRAMLNAVFQMMYQRNVSRKTDTRSITYMIASMNAASFVHRLEPKYLSPLDLHPHHYCNGVAERKREEKVRLCSFATKDECPKRNRA
jgi:hypothetical protein